MKTFGTWREAKRYFDATPGPLIIRERKLGYCVFKLGDVITKL